MTRHAPLAMTPLFVSPAQPDTTMRVTLIIHFARLAQLGAPLAPLLQPALHVGFPIDSTQVLVLPVVLIA